MKVPENFIFKTLTADILASTTGTVSLNNVTGMVAGTGGDPQYAVITDSLTNPTKWEIIAFSTLGASSINVTARAQEGTTAQDFDSGSYLYQTVTNGLLDVLPQLGTDNTYTGANTFNGTTIIEATVTAGTSDLFYSLTDSAGKFFHIGTVAGDWFAQTYDGSANNSAMTNTYFKTQNANLSGFLYNASLEFTNISGGSSIDLDNATANPYIWTTTTGAGYSRLIMDGGTNVPSYVKFDPKSGYGTYLFGDAAGGVRVKLSTAPTSYTDGTALLSTAGGTMSGAIAMGSQKITGLANGTNSADAVNYSQLSAVVAGEASTPSHKWVPIYIDHGTLNDYASNNGAISKFQPYPTYTLHLLDDMVNGYYSNVKIPIPTNTLGGTLQGTYAYDIEFFIPIMLTYYCYYGGNSQDMFYGTADFTEAAVVPTNHVSTTAHIGFFIDDTTLYASNADGTTQTSTSLGVLTQDATYSLRFVYDAGTSIEFYVNEVLVATHTTNLPDSGDALSLFYGISNNAGTTSGERGVVIFNGDYIQIKSGGGA